MLAAISVSHLQKVIGQTTVLAIESLEVELGEVAAVVGPPGSGKTTLVEILAGRLKPTAGAVRIVGLDVAVQWSLLPRCVGVLFAENALYLRQSARSNLDFQRQLYALPGPRVEEVLELVGLSDCADAQAGKLPQALQRRLALGRAILHNPQVLLLDEPFAQLDAESVDVMSRVISGLAGAAVLAVANEALALRNLCRRIYELDRGRITSSYAPAEQRRPAHGLKIPARQADKVVLLNPAEVLYVRSDGGQTFLHTAGGEVPTRLSLAELEDRLGASGFFRAHRAYLVNLQRVKEVVPYTRDSFMLVLDDAPGTEIPLSKSSAKQLQSILGY